MRIIRPCRGMGLRAVAVFREWIAKACTSSKADEAYTIGPSPTLSLTS